MSGKITKMQNEQSNFNINKLRCQNSKPKLKIKGYKGLATLLGPNSNKYKLNKNQKRFRAIGRTSIAAIAAALTIGGGTIINNSTRNDAPATSVETQAPLQKDALLHEANEKLFDYALGENKNNLDNYYITYQYDKNDNNTTVSIVTEKNLVTEPIHSAQEKSVETVFRYSNTLSFDRFQNTKEISSLLNNMIAIYHSNTPTQKQLQELSDSIASLEGKEFKLEGNHIVAVKEKSDDNER